MSIAGCGPGAPISVPCGCFGCAVVQPPGSLRSGGLDLAGAVLNKRCRVTKYAFRSTFTSGSSIDGVEIIEHGGRVVQVDFGR